VSIVQSVCRVWKSLLKREQKMLVRESMVALDAGWRMRCKIIRNLVRGESPSTISRILGCGRSQVYRVMHRFVADGVPGLVDRREDNGTAKVTEDFEGSVLLAVSTSPQQYGYQRPTWTQELLTLVTAEQTGIQVRTTTMCRLLARLDVRHGRPKPTVSCPWPKACKTRCLNRIIRLRDNLPSDEVVLYEDEVDIHLNPKIGNDWMLRGQQKEVLTPGQNQKRYLAGAFNPGTGRLFWVEGLRKTGALFIDLVDSLRQTYRTKRCLHLVLDNFKIHSSKAVAAAQLRWGDHVQLHFLPPYCPDHNRIERIWKDLHDNVTRNHTCLSMDELMNRVTDYLKQRRRSGKHKYVQAT
jgi:transposase